MGFLNTILEIIFPSKCLSCGKRGADLCLECLISVPFAERESAQWIFPIYDYRNAVIKNALWLLKYGGKRRLASVFAEEIYAKIIEELSEMGPLQNFINPIIIPIPIASKRLKERGFNQAELICKEIINLNHMRHGTDGKPDFTLVNNILIKPRETEHQARIRDRGKRLKNIVGSFTVQDDTQPIKNRNIILIDDITTTGATLSEAKKILKKSGARKVIAFTVAH